MSNDIDLSSKEWCDLIFEDAKMNKEFGAYQLRRTSVQRHNKAVVYTIIGFVAVVALAWGFLAVKHAIEERQLADTMQNQTAQIDFGAEEQSSEESEKEEIKQEEEKPEEPEVAQQSKTEIQIVEDNKVTKPPVTNTEVEKNDANIGAQNVESDLLGGINMPAPSNPAPAAVVENVAPVEAPKPAPKEDDNKVFTSVEQMPQFPGGDAALLKYIGSHIQYPAMAQENGTQGKVVLQFVVTKTGHVGEVKVLRSLAADCDKEAIRVVKSLPKFTPGRQNGQAVNVWYTLPVTFKLQQ